jgi:hypothetical protein
MRNAIIAIAVGLLAWFVWPVPALWPDSEAGIRVVVEENDAIIAQHAEEVRGEYYQPVKYETKRRVNLDKWRKTTLGAADEVAQARQIAAESYARATGSLLNRPFPRISPLDRFWVDTTIPVVGPLHVWVTPNDANKVWREAAQKDETGPEGIKWDATNRMPPIHNNKGKVADSLPYLALIGRVGAQVVMIGSQAVLCPEPNANLGHNLLARVNIFVTASGHLVSSYDNDLRGGYSIQFKAVDATWCDPINTRIRVEWIH